MNKKARRVLIDSPFVVYYLHALEHALFYKRKIMKKTIIALVVGASLALAGCNEPTTEESIVKGTELLANKDYRGASIEFKAALQRTPDSAEARIGLAKVALSNRDFNGAITELERAKSSLLEEGKDTSLVNALLGRAAHRSDTDIALMALKGKGNPEVAYYQIIRLTNEQELEKSKALYDTIKNDGSVFTKLAKVLVDSVEFSPEVAATNLPSLEDGSLDFNDVSFSETALLSAGVALREGEMNDAIDFLSHYQKRNPKDLERTLQLAHLMVSERRYDDARPLIDDLLVSFPQHGMINELGAVIAYDDKNYEKALSTSSAAIVSNPQNVMPRLISAYSSEMTGDSKTALDNLEFVIDKLSPDHPAQRLYIKLKTQNGELDDVAERALELNDLTANDAPLLSNLGLEMMRRGNTESAKRFADKAESLGAEGDGKSALGLLQLSLGDDDAFKNLESAFSNDPSSMVAGNSLATAYLTSNRFDDALALGNKWVSEGKNVSGYMLKGVSLARLGDHQEAKIAFNAVLQESPSHFMARAGVLETSIQLDQGDEAADLFAKWVVEEGMAGLFRNYLAAWRAVSGDMGANKATSQFDSLIDNGALGSADAYLVSGQAHYLMRDFEKASERLSKVSGALSKSPNYYLLSATVNERIENNPVALDAYREWQKLEPSLPLPVIGQVRVLAKLGQYDDAINALDSAMPNLDNKLPGRIMRMQLLIAKRDWGQLRSDYMRLPLDVQETPFAKAVNGVLEVQRGNYEAATDIAPLLKDYPNEEFLRWMVAGYSQVPTLNPKLITLLKQFVEQEPNSALAQFMLGNEYAGRGGSASALPHYEAALRITPDNALVLNNTAYTEIKTGEIDDAVKHARMAVELAPTNASFTETLGSALIESGNKEEAYQVMKALLDTGRKVNATFMETYKRSQD
jgi:putative PEP-CTERM system TPR-repeat lipoprotein